ncbi:unnamed protein product [Chrysodeixis includens]|uniref:Cytochrome P450 n=1 Tax=Chrysodeixis includens TaxID=689277 RepID=A0A9P0BQ60_CHRIL|nr:unnamed protein product [Chrysodeixis includens]
MLTLALFCCACAAYWLWRRQVRKITEPPYLPGAWPILGHAPMFMGGSRNLCKRVTDIANRSYDIGGVYTASIGPRKIYIVTDPDVSYTIFNTCLEKDDLMYEIAKTFIGDGLVVAKVPRWKKHRKLLNPTFSHSVLATFMGVFNHQARKLVRELEKEAGKGYFDHWTYTRHNALQTVCLTVLGVDFNDTNNPCTQYLEALETVFATMVERLIKFWWHSPRTFAFSDVKRRQDASLRILHNLSNTALQKRKSEFTGKVCAERSIIPGTKFKTYLDRLLELTAEKGVFDDREIREQLDNFIVGGHDTTANVLMYTMILLGSHPEVQEKAFIEIQKVFGNENRDVDKTDLPKLVYIEAVLKESIRMFSTVPILMRKLDRDIKLENYSLLKGRTCFLFLFAIHKHPMWGPDVHEFKPERWLEPGRLPDKPFAFAAFSTGRRMCIGKPYAIMSLKTTFVHVIRSYRITADHTKVKLKMDAALKPDSGYYVSIEKRT